MTTERIRLLVTVVITHDGTPRSRRDAIRYAKANAMRASGFGPVSPKRVTLVKPPQPSRH